MPLQLVPCEHTFLTSEGSAQGRFQRACERGSVFDAEQAARDLGYVSLPNALRLLAVYAAAEDPKYEQAAVRFLGRLLAERRGQTLGSVLLAASALVEFRGGGRSRRSMS